MRYMQERGGDSCGGGAGADGAGGGGRDGETGAGDARGTSKVLIFLLCTCCTSTKCTHTDAAAAARVYERDLVTFFDLYLALSQPVS